MTGTRRLLRNKEITYSAAKEDESNILHRLGYHDKQTQFFAHLRERRDRMKVIAAHHLGLRSSNGCRVADQEDWMHGSFNVCIPITVGDWDGKRVLIRFPLPYRIGEETNPGNGDEKIRCEAGTYAWLQRNCPDVPIPHLYGFGLSTGETFTRVQNLPIFLRMFQHLRHKVLSWLGYQTPSNYARHQLDSHNVSDGIHGAGYLLVEYIEPTQGTMLSNTWAHGSCQLAALSAMRTITPAFFQRDLRRGPFSFMLTDVHQSNIFVDAEWNITCLVDLEWACSRPIEMVEPPYWLTSKGVDGLDAAEYNSVRTELMEILAAEEEARTTLSSNEGGLPRLSDVMNRAWESGTFWYTLALSSPSGMFTIFDQHIRPTFCPKYGDVFNAIMPFFWKRDVGYITDRKLSDKEEYDRNLRQAFGYTDSDKIPV
ncbi:hypothetical protein HFD88_003497 [Aspergillus terreus]|nr:hypothetical protein HFD88_003497 [Aspergillus terreus]